MKSIIEIRNVTKQYPGVIALNDVSLSFTEGEVHALLGENGAGKSTLIKVLSGAIIPDGGEIICDGDTYHSLSPALSQRLGISVIYQEFNLVPTMTVAENIFLGREMRSQIWANKKEMIRRAEQALSQMDVKIDPRTRIADLSIAQQQMVEIVKAIANDVRVLIMDEPTAPLTTDEVQKLFSLVQMLKQKGVTIVYISHRLEELFQIADRVTILRDGKYVKTIQTADTNERELIQLMVGRPVNQQYPPRNSVIKETILEVEGLCSHNYLKNISFSLKRGEVLGLAGLVGAGRTELLRAIFGADKKQSGTIVMNGRELVHNNTSESIENGLAFIPEDRKMQGLLLDKSIRDNMVISSIRRASKWIFLNHKALASSSESYIDKLRIKTPGSDQLVRNLSGGNQQKVVIAKCLITEAKVYLFDEPTRGIDVGAKLEIYNLINSIVAQGNAVILASSEMPELIGMTDRILVMHEGEIVGELSHLEANQERIMAMASGTNFHLEGEHQL